MGQRPADPLGRVERAHLTSALELHGRQCHLALHDALGSLKVCLRALGFSRGLGDLTCLGAAQRVRQRYRQRQADPQHALVEAVVLHEGRDRRVGGARASQQLDPPGARLSGASQRQQLGPLRRRFTEVKGLEVGRHAPLPEKYSESKASRRKRGPRSKGFVRSANRYRIGDVGIDLRGKATLGHRPHRLGDRPRGLHQLLREHGALTRGAELEVPQPGLLGDLGPHRLALGLGRAQLCVGDVDSQ